MPRGGTRSASRRHEEHEGAGIVSINNNSFFGTRVRGPRGGPKKISTYRGFAPHTRMDVILRTQSS